MAAGNAPSRATMVVVMGVSGSGKSTFGAALAEALGARFLDADDLHPLANRQKMAAGIALDDDDRRPWLDAVAAWMAERIRTGQPGVVACSALRRHYRDRLRAAGPSVRFVYLALPRAELDARMRARVHFMPVTLLDSQLAALEPPGADEAACTVDGGAPLEHNLQRVLRWLTTSL
ncbi:gluconokinase [Dyella sp.]|uniref:gluconokinase n=1 Tax=Dyella sp. TaxID=1869338 RepID=UPI003F80FCB7